MYSDNGITFDSARSWSFGNEFVRNVVTCGDDNSSPSHVDNRKNNYLLLQEGPTYGINGKFGSAEKRFSINFSKGNAKCCLSLHYNTDNSYFLLMENKYFFKRNVNFPTQFRLGSISNGISATESREISLNRYRYDFSVDSNSIDKSNILDIHKYLMTKNNIK